MLKWDKNRGPVAVGEQWGPDIPAFLADLFSLPSNFCGMLLETCSWSLKWIRFLNRSLPGLAPSK